MAQQNGGSHANSCSAHQILIPQLLPQQGQHDHCTQHACDQACMADDWGWRGLSRDITGLLPICPSPR